MEGSGIPKDYPSCPAGKDGDSGAQHQINFIQTALSGFFPVGRCVSPGCSASTRPLLRISLGPFFNRIGAPNPKNTPELRVNFRPFSALRYLVV